LSHVENVSNFIRLNGGEGMLPHPLQVATGLVETRSERSQRAEDLQTSGS
jgi:hypothetical protein